MTASFPSAALDWETFDLRLEHAAQVKLEALSGKRNVLTWSPGRWRVSAKASIAADWTGSEQAAAEAIDAWLASLAGASFSTTLALPVERYRPLAANKQATGRLVGTETLYILADPSGVEVGMYGRAPVAGENRLFQVTSVVGSTITVAPDIVLDVPFTFTAEAQLTARLADDTPEFLGDPQFYGPWRVEMVEAV